MPVKLTVRRHSFTIACEKGAEESMREAARTVDEMIKDVREKWQVADGERAAIMAALTLANRPESGGAIPGKQTMERLCKRIDAALLRTAPRGRASDGVNQ